MIENEIYLKPLTDKNAQLVTRGNTQLPASAFANVGAFAYISGNQTSQRYGTVNSVYRKR